MKMQPRIKNLKYLFLTDKRFQIEMYKLMSGIQKYYPNK